MNSLRTFLVACLIALVCAAAGASIYFSTGRAAEPSSWSMVSLPGSTERIAAFPEFVRLSQIEFRPAGGLAPLPFKIVTPSNPVVTPTVEQGQLFGAPSLAPRAPSAIVAALAAKPALSSAECEALTNAYLDLGDPEKAVAARAAYLRQHPNETQAHWALIDLLDQQNFADRCLAALENLLGLLLQKGKAAKTVKDWSVFDADAKRLLEKQRGLTERLQLKESAEQNTNLRLIDAFPERSQLLLDYAASLAEARQYQKLLDVLIPRLPRCPKIHEPLWSQAVEAYRAQGKLDEALRRIEEDPALFKEEELYNLYAQLLRESGLVDSRRAALEQRLKTQPDVVTLRNLVLLDTARDRYDLARDVMQATLPRLGPAANAAELMQLAELAEKAGLPQQAAMLAGDAALAAGPAQLDIMLAAAQKFSQAPAKITWPLEGTAQAAFALDFIDAGPGVFGGLVSLGTNRMSARGAMQNMPATAARMENQRLAVRLALSAAQAADNAQSAYRATDFAVRILKEARQADRLDQLADALMKRFGEKQANAGRIMLWHADAMRLRKKTADEIAALQRALQVGQQLGQFEAATDAELRLAALLTQERRYAEVLALKWRRVEARPDDEAALAGLISFAEEHKLFDDETRAYRLALERFNRGAWSDKFARWLLREKRQAEFEALTLEAAQKLGENDLAVFIGQHLSKRPSNEAGDLFLEKILTLALQRFPANLEFNRRLLEFYEYKGFLANKPIPAYQDKYIDLGLRVFALDSGVPDRLLPRAAQKNMLAGMLAKLSAQSALQPTEAYFWAQAQVFQSHYEPAMRAFEALDQVWPRSARATEPLVDLAGSLANSFYVRDPSLLELAAGAQGRLADRDPLALEPRSKQGEILLQSGHMRQAATAWERIVAAGPGEQNRWLELATLYWDYYLPDQALDTLSEARRHLAAPELFGKEVAYLLEEKGKLSEAVAELVNVALSDGDTSWEATQRLRYLIRAKKTTAEKVDEIFWVRLKRSEGKSSEGLAYLRWLREDGAVVPASQAALKLLPVYQKDVTFAEGAYAFFAQYNDDAGMKACLERMMAISGRDPSMLRRLIGYYENKRDFAAGDKLAQELIAKADTPSAKHDELTFVANYYWRTKRPESALPIYRQRAEQAGDAYLQLDDWVVYARRCTEFGRTTEALEALEKLRAHQPTEPTIVEAMAEAYAAAKDQAGLAKLYQNVLKDLRDAPMDKDAKKEREVQLRRKLIETQTALGQPRDAIEQHIAIINRLAPDETAVLDAHRYAKLYRQLEPLLAYYEKEAKRANRDYRWQWVCGVLYEAEGRYPEAAHMYDQAAANEPQRNDLLERRALALIKAGDFDSAVAVYRTLSKRKLTGEDYQMRVAEVLYLAGQAPEAEKWLDQCLTGDKLPVERLVSAVQLADRFNRPAARLAYANRAMEMILDQPDKRLATLPFFQLWLKSQIAEYGPQNITKILLAHQEAFEIAAKQTHQVGQTTINSSRRNLQQTVETWLASWLGETATAEQRAQLADSFGQLLKPEGKDPEAIRKAYFNAIAAALHAQLPSIAQNLQAQLIQALLANQKNDLDKVSAMLAGVTNSIYALRGLVEPFPVLAAETAALNQKYKNSNPLMLQKQAVFARAAGAADTELTALSALFRNHEERKLILPNVYASRYLELLTPAQLAQLAEGACPQSGPLTVWLADQGHTKLAAAAIDFHFAKKEARWHLAKKALLYQADPAFAKQAQAAYAQLLGLPLTIDALVKQPPAKRTVYDEAWTYYSRNYGQWLLSQKQKEGLSFLYAEVERHPTSWAAYLGTITNLDDAKQFDDADSFFARAGQFTGDDAELIEAQAVHLAAKGDNREAAKLLDGLMVRERVSLDQIAHYAQILKRIGYGDQALDRWQTILLARRDKLTAYDRRDRIAELLDFARGAVSEKQFTATAKAVLATGGLEAGDLRDLIDDHTVPDSLVSWTWNLALERAENNPQVTVYVKRELAEAALAYALTVKDQALARRGLALIERMAPDALTSMPICAQRIRMAVYFEGAKQAEALALRFLSEGQFPLGCHEGSDEGPNFWVVIHALENAGLKAEADRVFLTWINRQEKLGPISSNIDYLRLESMMRLGRAAEAQALLVQMTENLGENAGDLAALSVEARRNGLTKEALQLAQKVAALEPNASYSQAALILAYLANRDAGRAAAQLSGAWTKNIFGMKELDDLLGETATLAVKTGAKDWEDPASKLPLPLRNLALAHLYLAQEKGKPALETLAQLTEPLRYPRIVWRLRAQAARLAKEPKLEEEALIHYLTYSPYDKYFSIRRAWLELADRPFAGLFRLSLLGLPIKPDQLADPFAVPTSGMQAMNSWWQTMPLKEREGLAQAIMDAFLALDRPAAALSVGQAAIADIGPDASRALRVRVEKLTKELDRRRQNRPYRFIPTDNLVQ